MKIYTDTIYFALSIEPLDLLWHKASPKSTSIGACIIGKKNDHVLTNLAQNSSIPGHAKLCKIT